MIKQVLQSIEGVAAYPVISLILFLVAFLSVVYLTWRLSPAEVERISRLPLDDDGEDTENSFG